MQTTTPGSTPSTGGTSVTPPPGATATTSAGLSISQMQALFKENFNQWSAPFATAAATAVARPLTKIPTYHYGAEHWGNMQLRTHDNKVVRFYDDLLAGKISIMNFFYADCQGVCPVATSNLKKVAELIKPRLGKDHFMYSFSLKPEKDTPAKLREYREMHGIENIPGWIFLTGTQYDLDIVRFRVSRWDNPGFDLSIEQHTGGLVVFNDNLARTSMVPSTHRPDYIVETISWVYPTRPLNERLKENREWRAGDPKYRPRA